MRPNHTLSVADEKVKSARLMLWLQQPQKPLFSNPTQLTDSLNVQLTLIAVALIRLNP